MSKETLPCMPEQIAELKKKDKTDHAMHAETLHYSWRTEHDHQQISNDQSYDQFTQLSFSQPLTKHCKSHNNYPTSTIQKF